MTQPSATNAKMVDKNNNPQIADRGAAITAADESHAVNGVTELDLLGVAINEIITALEAHGLIADN